MIPILFEKNETDFTNNGLGRLRDCISCVVTEERNGIYECDFEYPVDGAHFDEIQCGRIIGVEHDYSNDVQPFDIVSYSKQIDGKVSFHAVHISYRQSYLTVSGTNINNIDDAFTMLGNAEPENPFTYWTDQSGESGYMAAADGVPRSVRQMLGGVEGSILDTYRGEYEWNKFTVKLWSSRGEERQLTIRYGVNLLDYNEDTDYSESYTAVVPYWTGDDNGVQVIVKGNRVDSNYISYNGRNNCVPLNLTDKFETKPTTAQLESMASNMMISGQVNLPNQSIKVDFVRLQDSVEYSHLAPLMQCGLCDTIRVEFPRYGMSGKFKIVKTVYDVLLERFEEMELGTLSVSLADALGIGVESSFSSGGGDFLELCYPVGSYYETSDPTFDPNVAWGGTWTDEIFTDDEIVEEGTDSIWTYRKWKSGIAECWGHQDIPSTTYSANGGYRAISAGLPSGLFSTTPDIVNASGRILTVVHTSMGFTSPNNANSIQTYLINRGSSAVTQAGTVYWIVKGIWKTYSAPSTQYKWHRIA